MLANTRAFQRRRMNAEVNLTNLIDVMMVMLVVFMIATPLLAQGLNLSLPETVVSETLNTSHGAILVEVDQDSKVFVNSELVPFREVGTRVASLQKLLGNVPVNVRGDQGLSFGYGVELLGLLREQGVTNIGIETLPAPRR